MVAQDDCRFEVVPKVYAKGQPASCCVYKHLVFLCSCGDMEPAIMEFTMTARSRGAPALIFNGFKYLVSGKIYWICAVNRKCGGSVATEDCVPLRENAVHTQPNASSGTLSGQKDLVMHTERFRHVGKVRLVPLSRQNESRQNEM